VFALRQARAKESNFAETQIPDRETVYPGGSFNRRTAMPASPNGEAAFDAEVTNAMGRAFEETCSALHIPFHDIGSRQAVASRIIDLARAGVTDAGTLRDRVVIESHSKI
jgi:hypothetical protein